MPISAGRLALATAAMLGGRVVCLHDGSCCMQVVARTREDILAARGVKPTLSPNLNVLATVEALDVKRLLFIGVGCQVQVRQLARSPASRARLPPRLPVLCVVERRLALDKLGVLGTNCLV